MLSLGYYSDCWLSVLACCSSSILQFHTVVCFLCLQFLGHGSAALGLLVHLSGRSSVGGLLSGL